LGFSDTTKTERANRSRLLQLQVKRLDQAEQIHLAADQAIALAVARMISRPDDARGISEAAEAVRDFMAAYRDLVAIDQGALANAAALEEAYAFIDGPLAIAIRGYVSPEPEAIEPGPGLGWVRGAVEPEPEQEGADHDQPE
jgi:hypothetical protein